ncbi:universal stress protein [Sunxiuqinia sp. A32]|uniref:universal stress protein n=1 Tax=Sunxiuqinia sp. A32 TaxID=3461496 RepID=UPI0040455AAD
MEEKIITIALLPYSKAEVLRSMLEAKGISCSLEHVNLIQGAVATGVKVQINAKDVQKAFPILDKLLGKLEKNPIKTENIILIPVDFSSYSLKAAEVAIEICQKLEASLVFYHVISQPDYFTIPYSDVIPFDAGLYNHLKEREGIVQEEFKMFLRKLSEKTGEKIWKSLKIDQIVKMGYPEEDILNYTDAHPPRLIVMGIRGFGQDAIMGSTTAGVIYKANVPVLVLPEDTPDIKLSSVKSIVYATNFDDNDFLSINKLLGLLKPFDTEVTCLHIGVQNDKEWDKAKLKSMSNALKKNYKEAKLNFKIVEGEDVLSALETYIEKNKVDILALTTHKRNMITRIFNPSIAKKMVFHLKTPLFVFHA